MVELGFKDFDVTIWYGIVAPAKVPTSVVSKLNSEINLAMKDPKLASQLSELGVQVQAMSPAEFGDLIKELEAQLPKGTWIFDETTITSGDEVDLKSEASPADLERPPLSPL